MAVPEHFLPQLRSIKHKHKRNCRFSFQQYTVKFPFADTPLKRTPPLDGQLLMVPTDSHIICIMLTLSRMDILLNGQGRKENVLLNGQKTVENYFRKAEFKHDNENLNSVT